MIVGIANIYLYTGLSSSASDSYEAKKWMDENNITYTHLHYGDESQHKSVFDSLSTWWPDRQEPITEFPFVVYEERHDDYSKVQRLIYGLDAIKASNISEMSLLGNAATGA